MKRLETSKGFTLIEMLVVISIIGILAALLMPSLVEAQHAALRVTCSNNLKNSSVAIGSYGVDYGGNWFPPPVGPGRNWRITWEVLLLPYYGINTSIPSNIYNYPADYLPGVDLPASAAPTGMKLFVCPFDKYEGYGGRARRSYRVNNGGDGAWADGTARTRFEAYKYDRLIPRYNPNHGKMRMGLIGDCANQMDGNADSTIGFMGGCPSVYWSFSASNTPHPDMDINILMADFSVYKLSGDLTVSPDPLIRPWMQFRTRR